MVRIFKSTASRRTFIKRSISVATVLPMAPRFSMAQGKRLNFYNWDTYIGETTVQDFTTATGIEVNYSLYADNAELFARLREGNPGYDLIVPTNDWVNRMVQAGMLMELDHSKLPNMSNLEERFREASFDPGRKHSMPYFWGTIGIGYRESLMSSPPDSWSYVIGEKAAENSGRISWLSEAKTVMQMALKMLGYSLNSTDPNQFKEAEAALTAAKAHVKAIAGDNGQDLLLSQEVDLAMEWNGDIAQVAAEDDDIKYALPAEGGLLWQDCLSIPTGAPDPDSAHEMINYIMDAEVAASIADYVQYATPNQAAKALLSAEYLENPAIFPPAEVLDKAESSDYLGEDVERMYDEAMTRIRAA